MKRLWAPWRMTYINGIPKSTGCFLCEAARDPAGDLKNLVVWRSGKVFCIMNRFPYNNGHLMVAPLGHGGELAGLSVDERASLVEGLARSQALLEKVMKPDGFNMGLNVGKTAGAGVTDHLHVHIVPRWDGDTNFMPVLADTKVMPEALSDLYAKLKEAL